MIIRPMGPGDLVAVYALQDLTYPPALRDGPAAFESRLALSPDFNLVAEIDGTLAGYLVSHPWLSAAPAASDVVVLPTAAECWFIHDLSVAPHARRAGTGRRLVEAGLALARQQAFTTSELIAVEGAHTYWAALGWQAWPDPSPVLAAKVAGYGEAAVYMSRPIKG
jgi:GNAT superfamily N-acetyltransferase